MGKKKLPEIKVTGTESLDELVDIRNNVDNFIAGAKLEEYSSDELATFSAQISTLRNAVNGKFKVLAMPVNQALDKVLKLEQQARRNANPEEYDKKHQGIGAK